MLKAIICLDGVYLEVNLIHQSLIQVVVDVDLVEVAYHAVIQLLFQPFGLLNHGNITRYK